jgi:hypothetical protein
LSSLPLGPTHDALARFCVPAHRSPFASAFHTHSRLLSQIYAHQLLGTLLHLLCVDVNKNFHLSMQQGLLNTHEMSVAEYGYCER